MGSGDWIEWAGEGDGPPEIDGLRCDLKFKGGYVDLDVNSYDYWANWNWGVPDEECIVAYRLGEMRWKGQRALKN